MAHNKADQEGLKDSSTIAAVATPPGQSAIAVIRVSGPGSAAMAEALAGRRPEHGRASLLTFRDGRRQAIDQGLALYFAAPRSFTGEDMLELHCHGSVVVLEQLMQALAALGARPARPGEFSERAFVNGKMDLSQAEAIAALIASGNAAAARVAAIAVTGEWARRLHELDKSLLSLRARLEAELDFPEEDVGSHWGSRVEAELEGLAKALGDMRRDGFRGQQLQRGMNVVLAGLPNSGKSTLLNALCGKERAIVTDQPGTTRDLLHEDVTVSGIHVSLVDTAGLREASDIVEQAGMEKARQAMAQADLILLLSAGEDSPELLRQVREHASDCARYLHVRTKTDICGAPDAASPQVGVCAPSGEGLDLLRSKIAEQFMDRDAEQSALYMNTRMAAQLGEAAEALSGGLRRWREHAAPELLLADLAAVQEGLAGITGAGGSEELLAEIFSRFCIGK